MTTTTNKIDTIRRETLRILDRQIASEEEQIKRHLGWVRNNVDDAIRVINDNGVFPSNGFLMRSSSTHELDLATTRCAALKQLRGEIAAVIDWIADEEE